MKAFIMAVILLLLVNVGFTKPVGPLPEVMKPDNIAVYKNELYVMEGAKVSIYSLKDLKPLRKFGQKGEGPGELQVLTNLFYNKISVFPEYIFVVGANKVIFFSKEGKPIKEKKKTPLVISKKSPQGFFIEVFDLNGNKLYQIREDYEKIKITGAHKKEIIERFRKDPRIKLAIQQVGGWEELKKRLTMKFTDFFPAIQSLHISNQKLYVQTYKVVDNQSEYVIMDLKGKVMKRVFLPRFENTPLMSKILDAKLHTIYDDKLYYLMENEDQEKWELYIEEIK